jgi:hypothetical protein
MLSREDLQAMKRAELQKLCKRYGLSANLKSASIIDLLVSQQRYL